MAERISETLQKKVSDRLSFYQDLGIDLFYRDRRSVATRHREGQLESPATTHFSTPEFQEGETLPKPAAKPAWQKTAPVAPPPSPKIASLPVVAGPSLFESMDKIAGDSLLKVREDLGECTRCKLHSTRHKIVFGDGNPKAQLVFVGEGPGADEDAQGLPFVGRAGKLLTQMIEAMGLQRKDVYICNVVKCRPPENRQPEKDEVATCSPFLLRQIDVSAPRVIGCLGSVAAQSERQGRSLERPAESDDRARPRSEERQIRLIRHGHLAGTSDGAHLGECRFYCSLRDPPYRHAADNALYAVHRLSSVNNLSAVAGWLGASRGWIRVAAVGLGITGGILQRVFDTCAVSRIRNREDGGGGAPFGELPCADAVAVMDQR